MNKQQGNALSVTIIIIIAVSILGVLGFLFYQNFMVKKDTVEESSQQLKPEQEVIIPAPLKEYRSKSHNISFSYPDDWSLIEQVDEWNTDNWYVSSVKVLNVQGKEVASLGTGGQIGGLCSEDAPLIPVSTIIKDSINIEGISKANFGYTIIQGAPDNYGVAFGLMNDDLILGDTSERCPHMSVNYKYYIRSKDEALGGIAFGIWYGEPQVDNPNTYLAFSSFDEAKAYAQSDEFKQIKSMIGSLRIGE